MSTQKSGSTKRRSKQSSASRKRKSQERMVIGGVTLTIIVIIAVIVAITLIRRPPDINLAGIPDNSTQYPIQESTHIDQGAPHPEYNSNPPTSGWHYGQDANLGVYTESIADELLVHNLEHGHVWLSYRDADDEEALDILRQVQQLYPSQILVTLRPENDSRIAASA